MARVAVPVSTLAAYGGKALDITWTAGSGDNHAVTHPGGKDIVLMIKNASGAPITTTILAVASPRTLQMAENLTVATAAGKESFVAIPAVGYDQGAGVVHVNLSAHANLSLYALKVTDTPTP
jgi:hypothetical protein